MLVPERDTGLGVIVGPGIGLLFHIHQYLRQMSLHLPVVPVIVRKLAVFVHQVVTRDLVFSCSFLG